jgi:membrane-bound metal-dependent hydrolase YbcI (DUF457 family)
MWRRCEKLDGLRLSGDVPRDPTAWVASLARVRNTTHELIGVLGAVAASRALDLDTLDTAAAVAGAVWGSWLPDADRLGTRLHRRGRLGRRNLAIAVLSAALRLPLRAFALLSRHRGGTHSLAACALFAALAAVVAAAVGGLGAALAPGCALGYCAHVLADGCTPSGVGLWRPFSSRRVRLLPRRAMIPTGSFREAMLAVMAATAALALVVL